MKRAPSRRQMRNAVYRGAQVQRAQPPIIRTLPAPIGAISRGGAP